MYWYFTLASRQEDDQKSSNSGKDATTWRGSTTRGRKSIGLTEQNAEKHVYEWGAKKREGWRRLHSHLTQSSCWGSRGGHHRIIHPGASGSEPGLGVQPPRITEWRERLLLHSCPPAGGRMLADLHINQSWVKKEIERKNRMPSQGWISPSTLTVIGCDSTTIWLTLSLQRYSPASDRCTFLILQSNKDARHCLRLLWRCNRGSTPLRYLTVERRLVTPSVMVCRSLIASSLCFSRSWPFLVQTMV